MIIYHGSEFKIPAPRFGEGKTYNDYGQGFYCTENVELAKEWSCSENHDGFANQYNLNTSELRLLYLNSQKYTILHWLAILVQNRHFRLHSQVARDARDYLIDNFSINVSDVDVIIGYRADDSYFTFADDFLNNVISVRRLSRAMHLGSLGEQVVLKTEKAFASLSYMGAEEALRVKYYALRKQRENAARAGYLRSDRKHSYSPDEIYILDIMRQGVKADDPRLF